VNARAERPRADRRLASVALFLLLSRSLAAQAPTIPPPLPGPLAPSQYFTAQEGVWRFAGCATGTVVATLADERGLIGTPWCVNGLLTVGVGYGEGPVGHPSSFRRYGWLDMVVAADERIAVAPYLDGDTQWIQGTLVDASCPVGCVTRSSFSAMLRGSVLSLDGPLPGAIDGIFTPQSIEVGLYYGPGGSGLGTSLRTVRTTLTLTAVPEPSTYALVAAGLAGVLGFARRTRGRTRG
jgi:hypothetical protein